MTIIVLAIFWFRTHNVFSNSKLASTKTLLCSSFNPVCLNFSVLKSTCWFHFSLGKNEILGTVFLPSMEVTPYIFHGRKTSIRTFSHFLG